MNTAGATPINDANTPFTATQLGFAVTVNNAQVVRVEQVLTELNQLHLLQTSGHSGITDGGCLLSKPPFANRSPKHSVT